MSFVVDVFDEHGKRLASYPISFGVLGGRPSVADYERIARENARDDKLAPEAKMASLPFQLRKTR
ncbi:MAG: hypothetical protein ACT4P2_15835 [Pseudomonadota bacterium]